MSHPPWPADLIDAEEVRRWIAFALPGRPQVTGPVTVHWAKSWGVTARFAIRAGPDQPPPSHIHAMCQPVHPPHEFTEVVFKASLLPLFFYAPAVYTLLGRLCPQHVPELLAWELLPGRTFRGPHVHTSWSKEKWDSQEGRLFTLFRPFAGQSVHASGNLDALLEMARTLARIQVAVAAQPVQETAGLPRVPVESIPTMYDYMLREVRDRYLAMWAADGGALAKQFDIPPDVFDRLKSVQRKVEAWTAELRAGEWPNSIDHPDFHPGNAALQPGGQVLIYDWEEAVIGCPFFSVEELLSRAGHFATDGETRAIQDAIKDAYLDALPWHTRSQRDRAYDLGTRLSPIRGAYVFEIFHQAFGMKGHSSRGAAMLVGHAVRGWPQLE
ncbi:MAG: phosphotransferase [Chloroflexota bacterium]